MRQATYHFTLRDLHGLEECFVSYNVSEYPRVPRTSSHFATVSSPLFPPARVSAGAASKRPVGYRRRSSMDAKIVYAVAVEIRC